MKPHNLPPAKKEAKRNSYRRLLLATLLPQALSCGGTDGVCSGFENDQASPTTIVLRNNKAVTIYFGDRQTGCSRGPGWWLIDSGGNKVSHTRHDCVTCDSVMSGETCPNFSCLPADVVPIAPGEELHLEWGSRVFHERSLLIECRPDVEESPGNCEQASTAKGAFTFRATASLELSAEGVGAGGETSAETVATFPGPDSVTITFVD